MGVFLRDGTLLFQSEEDIGEPMMKKIGIVICNYNKREYVINCIQSVLESKRTDFDLYVVDNASTDDSVEVIKRTYGNQVNVLVNEENLGGSGGFNTGIRKVLEGEYEYLYCLDNDVLVDENAVGELADFLESNPNAGAAGSIVYHMDYPEYVQQYGLDIDFDHYTAITHYADFPDDGSIPEYKYCDTIATCSVMLRTSCIKNTDIGIMPEDNFIYWDDMEWIYRFKLAGFDVVTVRNSVVLHKMGSNVKPTNTFINYYMWRNRIHFFMRYTPEDKLDHMSYRILSAVFDSLYESMYREEHNVMQTISYAFFDAIRGVRGKASDGKILPNDANDNKFSLYLKNKRNYYIIPNENQEQVIQTENYIRVLNAELQPCESPEQADVVLQLCDYIMHVDAEDKKDPGVVYIDLENNVILDEEDWKCVQNYPYCRSLFIYMNQAPFLDAAQTIRQKMKEEETRI